MKLTYSKRILILSSLIFLGMLTLDLISSHLLVRQIADINNKVKQLAISTQERETNLSLKDSLSNSEAERVKLNGYFIEAGDAKTAEFIGQLESSARTAGLTLSIKSVDYEAVGEATATDIISFIRLRINVTGKWSSVFDFLKVLENLPKVVLVQNVNFSANLGLESNSKSSASTWSADIDFSVAKLKN